MDGGPRSTIVQIFVGIQDWEMTVDNSNMESYSSESLIVAAVALFYG